MGSAPFNLEAYDPDTPAFHEFIGDLAAMLSLFRTRGAMEAIVKSPERAETFSQLISDLAPQVAQGVYGNADRSFLRSADNDLKYSDVRDEPEVHRRSQVLSGFAFDMFEEVFRIRQQWDQKGGSGSMPRLADSQDYFRELVVTARHMARMFLRPLDLLPPGSIRFQEYAAIILDLDRRSFPDDARGYRKALERTMRKRGIFPAESERRMGADGGFDNRGLIERDINMIRSSLVGAYRFLDSNRRFFRIPENVDLRVVGLATNRREDDRGFRPPPETIIQYAWDKHMNMSKSVKAQGLERLVLHPGGTVMLDDNVNLL